MSVSQAPDSYAALYRQFRWQVPVQFNIAEVCCARWARQPDGAQRVAIRVHEGGSGEVSCTFAQLQERANRLSNLLRSLGVRRGDRVAIVMPQRIETAVAQIAVMQMGAVAMPLSMLFGPDALRYRFQDSTAKVALCDETSIGNVLAVRGECKALRSVIGVGGASAQADLAFDAAMAAQSARFTAVKTDADDPALLVYTSGTTGPPKGALAPHRALVGNLSGFVCSQNWFGYDAQPKRKGATVKSAVALPPEPMMDTVFWSPADWAWTGGLMDALLPSLYFGRPIVACSARFSAELAFTLMQQHGVTHSFLFPTALKAMMKAYPAPRAHFSLKLQAIMSAGEAVGDAVFAYCRDQLQVPVNEMFGQTEINYIVGNCSRFWPAKPGSMGRPYPGHRVAVIDEAGRECAVGVPGDVAVNRYDMHGYPDPVFFLGYWKNAKATSDKYTPGPKGEQWGRTGDLATRDSDGYLWYQGRADDVFKAAGYRIGPSEVENCLVKHPAVANAAVVPKPDLERGAVVKAYVVLTAQAAQARVAAGADVAAFDAQLFAALQQHVRGQLAPYEYPKEIEWVDALPMTTTGKVQRRVLRLHEEERFKAGMPVVPRV